VVKIKPTFISDVVIIEPSVYEDSRGFFMEIFQSQQYKEFGIKTEFVQDNLSGSHQGVLRGLHYQIYQPQGKLVQVLIGRIFDVAVDIRRSSESFGQWVGILLSSEDKNQLWIPEGFAHGYYVISDRAEVLYNTTDYYAPQAERTILWNDSLLGIQWPLIDGIDPIISRKDQLGKLLKEADLFD
jgi:dTDP-4-dehydrorhamnose 3,5-epimerase